MWKSFACDAHVPLKRFLRKNTLPSRMVSPSQRREMRGGEAGFNFSLQTSRRAPLKTFLCALYTHTHIWTQISVRVFDFSFCLLVAKLSPGRGGCYAGGGKMADRMQGLCSQMREFSCAVICSSFLEYSGLYMLG